MIFQFCDMKIRSLLFAKLFVIEISKVQAYVLMGYVFVVDLVKI